jgi:hypothetical protein
MKWWLVAVFLGRMDMYGTDSMEQCHAILASAERHEFKLLPSQLVDNLTMEGAVDLTCLDHETMLQLVHGVFGNMPKNVGEDVASDPRYMKKKTEPEGTDSGEQEIPLDPELPEFVTPKDKDANPDGLSPLPMPRQAPFWKVLPTFKHTSPTQEALRFPMPKVGGKSLLDEWGNPVWSSTSQP